MWHWTNTNTRIEIKFPTTAVACYVNAFFRFPNTALWLVCYVATEQRGFSPSRSGWLGENMIRENFTVDHFRPICRIPVYRLLNVAAIVRQKRDCGAQKIVSENENHVYKTNGTRIPVNQFENTWLRCCSFYILTRIVYTMSDGWYELRNPRVCHNDRNTTISS